MKKVILGLCLLFTVSLGYSQSVTQFFKNLEKSSEYAVVKVNKEMFELLTAMDSDLQKEKDVQELINGLNEITILIKENGGKSDYDKFQGLVSSNGLKSYMSVKDDDNNVNLYSEGTTSDGKLKGVVLSVNDGEQTIFINVDGLVDLSALGKLTKDINIDGFEQLRNLEKKN